MAHSLGTVVAYETLHVHLDLHVYLLVTVGSPLALAGAVRKMVTTSSPAWCNDGSPERPSQHPGIGRRLASFT